MKKNFRYKWRRGYSCISIVMKLWEEYELWKLLCIPFKFVFPKSIKLQLKYVLCCAWPTDEKSGRLSLMSFSSVQSSFEPQILIIVTWRCLVLLYCLKLFLCSFLVFPKVLLQMNNIDLNTRHGCILGCSEVIHALFLYAKKTGRYCDKKLKILLRYFITILTNKLKTAQLKTF